MFVVLPGTLAEDWKCRGVGFYQWPVPMDGVATMADDEVLVRLVTSFATTSAEVEEFASLLRADTVDGLSAISQ